MSDRPGLETLFEHIDDAMRCNDEFLRTIDPHIVEFAEATEAERQTQRNWERLARKAEQDNLPTPEQAREILMARSGQLLESTVELIALPVAS